MSKTDEGIKTKLTVSRLMKSLVVMLPTLDEEHGLLSVLPEIPTKKLENMGWNINIWVVDGGSEDQTIAIAKEHGCEVVKQAGTGKGAAMRTGFTKFLSSKHDALVMLDADGTYDAGEITNLLALLELNDVVIGDRLKGHIEPNAMTKLNYFGNHMLTWIASGLYGVPANDLCTGYWAFSKKAIASLKLNSMRFEIEAEMFASCVKEELILGAIPITYRARLGEAKLGSVVDGWAIFKKLLIRRIFGDPIEVVTGKGNLDMN